MTPWVTLALALMYGLSAAGLRPALWHGPWALFQGGFQVAHPLFLGSLALTLVLAAVPVEVRLGRWSLAAAWVFPLLLQRWFLHACQPELAAWSVMVCMGWTAWRRGETFPLRIWLPLLGLQALTMWVLRPDWSALGLASAVGILVSANTALEAVAVAGMAGLGVWLLAWVSY